MADNKRIVLAYSGGLDTSVAISYLKERTGKDVVAVSLDVGQGGESLETIKQRALACGAVESYVVDARDEFANEYCTQDRSLDFRLCLQVCCRLVSLGQKNSVQQFLLRGMPLPLQGHLLELENLHIFLQFPVL